MKRRRHRKRPGRRRRHKRFLQGREGATAFTSSVTAPIRTTLWKTPGHGPPSEFFVKLKFNDRYRFQNAAGAYAEQVYRMNGPYDPLVAVGGDYPCYYSELSAMYNKQTTIGSSIRCSFTAGLNAGGAVMAKCWIYPHLNQAGVVGFQSALDQRGIVSGVSTLYGPQLCLKNSCTVANIFGVPSSVVKNDFGTFGSNTLALPTNVAYWVVGVEPTENTPTTLDLTVITEIIYYIRFSGLKALEVVDSAND